MNLRNIRAIICYKTGLASHIYIHIPKNAGVAVRKAPPLKNRLVSTDPFFHKSRAYTKELAAYNRSLGEHPGFQHARWRDLDRAKLAHLQPVAIIRNPWSRTVSRFRFAQTAIQNGKADPSYIADTFEGFLEERHQYGGLPYYWHRVIRGWYPQVDYVTDENGNLKVDLLRYEKMNDDVSRYFKLAGPVRSRNVSQSGKTDYRTYYTPKTIQIIADWYGRDIETFGFDFDKPATKNMIYDT